MSGSFPDAADSENEGHYVYVVQCSDGSYYTGYTTDVQRRVAEHNDGTGAKYTRGRRPVELVHVESFPDQSRAMQREYAIKQWDRPRKERLVQKKTSASDA
ncbi:MAG: GIY-YIG nuclease family protein [Bacteroidetes bacterium SW_9_63_38]|nr:MAG: GIY-YIG nuclease family protein [Bacteroidetes bacterium SW_9_63_38]